MRYLSIVNFLFRFTINFHHGAADFSGNDVPLHMSVRFDEGKVIISKRLSDEPSPLLPLLPLPSSFILRLPGCLQYIHQGRMGKGREKE